MGSGCSTKSKYVQKPIDAPSDAPAQQEDTTKVQEIQPQNGIVGAQTPGESTEAPFVEKTTSMKSTQSKQSVSGLSLGVNRRPSMTEICEPLPEELIETSAGLIAKRRADKDQRKKWVMGMTYDNKEEEDVYASEPLSPGTKNSYGARMAARRASKGKMSTVRRLTPGKDDLGDVQDPLVAMMGIEDEPPVSMKRRSSKQKVSITSGSSGSKQTVSSASRDNSKLSCVKRPSEMDFKENQEPEVSP